MATRHKNNLLDMVTTDAASTGVNLIKSSTPSWSDKLDNAQLALSGAGMTPGVGIGPDIANMLVSLGRGKWGDALLDATAAIPGLGLMGGGINLGRRAKAAKNVLKSGENVAIEFPNKRFLDWENVGNRGGRDVVTVKLKDAQGKEFVQPFYKSSGTSGHLAGHRKGVWEPFGGRAMGGWYMKGGWDKADDFKLLMDRYLKKGNFPEGSLKQYNMDAIKADANLPGFSSPKITKGMSDDDKFRAIDASIRTGRYADISKEIKRLEDLGYYSSKNYKKYRNPKELNTLLEKEGFKLF